MSLGIQLLQIPANVPDALKAACYQSVEDMRAKDVTALREDVRKISRSAKERAQFLRREKQTTLKELIDTVIEKPHAKIQRLVSSAEIEVYKKNVPAKTTLSSMEEIIIIMENRKGKRSRGVAGLEEEARQIKRTVDLLAKSRQWLQTKLGLEVSSLPGETRSHLLDTQTAKGMKVRLKSRHLPPHFGTIVPPFGEEEAAAGGEEAPTEQAGAPGPSDVAPAPATSEATGSEGAADDNGSSAVALSSTQSDGAQGSTTAGKVTSAAGSDLEGSKADASLTNSGPAAPTSGAQGEAGDQDLAQGEPAGAGHADLFTEEPKQETGQEQETGSAQGDLFQDEPKQEGGDLFQDEGDDHLFPSEDQQGAALGLVEDTAPPGDVAGIPCEQPADDEAEAATVASAAPMELDTALLEPGQDDAMADAAESKDAAVLPAEDAPPSTEPPAETGMEVDSVDNPTSQGLPGGQAVGESAGVTGVENLDSGEESELGDGPAEGDLF